MAAELPPAASSTAAPAIAPSISTAASSDILPAFTGPTVPFDAIQMFDAYNGWAWGYEEVISTRIWRTSDGGLTWVDVTPEENVWSFGDAVDPQHAWVTVCFPQGEDCRAALMATSDGGETWELIRQTTWRSVSDYDFFTENDGLISGSGAAAGSAIWNFYETHDAGSTWEPFQFLSSHRGPANDIPGQYDACNICGDALYLDFERLVVVGGNLAQVADDVMPLWISFDRGGSWQDVELTLPSGPFGFGWFHPSPPVFIGEDFGVLAVRLSTHDRSQTSAAFYVTTDGGLNWGFRSLVEIPGSVERLTWVVAVSTQDMFFRCGRDLCVTHDGAQSWQPLSTNLNFETFSDTDLYVHHFSFADALNGWALVHLEEATMLWRTQDGGLTWTRFEPELLP